LLGIIKKQLIGERLMHIFIPTNDLNKNLITKGFTFGPLIIEAYQYHTDGSWELENTQKLLSRKVKTGTVITKKGKTLVE
jgi:hypothetical protein